MGHVMSQYEFTETFWEQRQKEKKLAEEKAEKKKKQEKMTNQYCSDSVTRSIKFGGKRRGGWK